MPDLRFHSHWACDCWSRDHYGFSPDAALIATVESEFKVVCRDAHSGIVTCSMKACDRIDIIRWAPVGCSLLCVMLERNSAVVFQPPKTRHVVRLDGGELGIEDIEWSDDGLRLILLCKGRVRFDVWDLRTQALVAFVAPTGPRAVSGSRFAYMTRAEGGDALALVDDWRHTSLVMLPTFEVAHLKFSPDGAWIAAADGALEHRVCVLAADGSCIRQFSAYCDDIGVTSMAWCPNSRFLAVGSGNGVVYLLLKPKWGLLTEISLVEQTRVDSASLWVESSPGKFAAGAWPVQGRDDEAAGVEVSWSGEGKFVAATSPMFKKAVFVFNTKTMKMECGITFLTPVTDAKWCPIGNTLAVSVGTEKICLWEPEAQPAVLRVEAALRVFLLAWAPDGHTLACFDKSGGNATLGFAA